MRLIQESGFIESALLELCRRHGINVPNTIAPAELNVKLQKAWFKVGLLRYQIAGEPPGDEDRTLLAALDFMDERRPLIWQERLSTAETDSVRWTISYAGAMLLGALRPRVVSRLHFFRTCAHTLGWQFGWKVWLLGGARPLDPVQESPGILAAPAELPFKPDWQPPVTMPATEAEMMELVWQQSNLPSYWHYELVNAPLQPKPDGSGRPPNTGDTVRIWLNHSPPEGFYLIISNQPFVDYQRLAVERHLPQGYSVTACGPAASPTLSLATYLDNIAKLLLEEVEAAARHPT